MTSSRSLVVTSNEQKCIRSCWGVMMPACRSPRNGTAWSSPPRLVLDADARPARVPPPAAPTTAAVTPAAPNSLRLDSPRRAESGSTAGVSGLLGGLLGGLLRCDDTLHLAYFLRQRVDRTRQLLTLRLGHLVVGDESVTLTVLLEQRLDLGEPLVHLLAEFGVALVDDRPHRSDGGLAALDVGLEVPQVGVAEDVLFTGDLALGDFVEQTLCAAGDLGGVDLVFGGLDAVVEFPDVGRQLVGERIGVRLQTGDPQLLLQRMEAGPLLSGLQVGLTKVDAGIEVVGERLGHRLDALVIGAGERELRLGGWYVALLHRVDEHLRRRDECVGLAVHVPLVALGRLLELALVVDLDGVAGDLELGADAVADHAWLARGLIGAGLAELHDGLALQPGRDVLHLAHHPFTLAVDVELLHLGAVVGDDERAWPRGGLGARELALGVGGGHRDLSRSGLAAVGAGGGLRLLGGATGQRDTGQQRRDRSEARPGWQGRDVHVVDLSGAEEGSGSGVGLELEGEVSGGSEGDVSFADLRIGRRKSASTMTR